MAKIKALVAVALSLAVPSWAAEAIVSETGSVSLFLIHTI